MHIYSSSLNTSLSLTRSRAQSRGHSMYTSEHLLYALLEDDACLQAIMDLGGDVERLEDKLTNWLSEHKSPEKSTPKASIDLIAVLESASIQAKSVGIETLTLHALEAIAALGSGSHAAYFLKVEGVEGEALRQIVAEKEAETQNLREQPVVARPEGESTPYMRDMVKEFKGKACPMIGRDAEVQRTIQILLRQSKNNPVLIGEAGVGKTAIAEGLAWLISQEKVPSALKDFRVFAVDISAMVAGAKYRGDFEERLRKTINVLQAIPNSIAFIDEIHLLAGAGNNNGGMDAANMLKPALARGLRCMGATTNAEWSRHLEKDPAIARRFQRVDVREPSIDDAILMAEGVCSRLERLHGIEIDQNAIKYAVRASDRFITDRLLPDKAFDVLDETCAMVRLAGQEKRVLVEHIEKTVAAMARLPLENVRNRGANTGLHKLYSLLSSEIFGQDEALDTIAREVRTGKAGLRTGDGVIAGLLLHGPTGVGKTETVAALARHLGMDLHRFDMSEYMEKHAISRLIGAPPGYAGHEQGGLLTSLINRRPNAIVLFDEIEKAHPDICAILLQILDYGKCTDSQGRIANFTQSIIVCTTNAGSFEGSKASIGFGSNLHGSQDGRIKGVEKSFTPEFRARFDAIVGFNPLDQKVAQVIAEKMIGKIVKQAKEQGVRLVASPEALALIASKGLTAQSGARGMRQVVKRLAAAPVADLLIAGALKSGDIADLTVADNRVVAIPRRTRKRHLSVQQLIKE